MFKLLLDKKCEDNEKKIALLHKLIEKYLSSMEYISEEEEFHILYDVDYAEGKVENAGDLMKSMMIIEDWLMVKKKSD